MKQAAFNRECRLAENFSVKHIINHSSHIKYSLCSIHAVCESMCRLAAVALEETPFFSSAKEGSFAQKIPAGVQLSFHSYLCLLMGSLLHADFLDCNGPTNATTGLLLHGIPVPLLHQEGKRLTPPACGREDAGGKPCSGETRPHAGPWWASSARRVLKRLAIPPNSGVTGRPLNAASLYSPPSDSSVVPPLTCDLPKFEHVSTDAVYRADSDCTCSYCNRMFK